jgi:GT2 family glycosyltransferase
VQAKVRISIVTYNSDKVFKTLDYLIEEFKNDSNYAISIYDNHSDEDFVEKLKMYEPFAEITFGSTNNGFGYGHNANLLKAMEDYFLIFNPDVLLKKAALEKMLIELENEKEASMMVPRITNEDGSTQHLIRSRFTIFDLIIRRFPIKVVRNMFSKRIAEYECVNLPSDQKSYIKIGSGCFILIKSKTFKALDGFDDRFFMYLEDYDFCLRVNKVSKIVYMPQVSVVHFWERGSGKNFKLAWIHVKSLFKFFNKWGWKWF